MTSELKDHPLLLIPKKTRQKLIEEVFKKDSQRFEEIKKSYLYNGDLSQRNRLIFDALLKNYKGDFKEVYNGEFIAIDENSTIILDNEIFTILHIPGHSPGSVGFYNATNKFIVNGDVLFKNGYGRTDLPFCNETDLFNSIKNKLFALPSETIVYTGHGEPTTIGEEKSRYNL
jgi:glyoxylase-like metal-dependent hydrolase (beta-lactamase superfamily II)